MKLIELSANKVSFKTVRFNDRGLTVIVGDAIPVSTDLDVEPDESSSNGVGKSLALRLVHFCLGSKKSVVLGRELPEWNFSLKFKIGSIEHVIERATDDSEIFLDGELTNLTALQRELNSLGAFNISEDSGQLTFRTLIKRFAREKRIDCESPLALGNEHSPMPLIASLFLLGLDYQLAIRKQHIRKKQISIKQARTAWDRNEVLKDLFTSGSEAVVRKRWLEQIIPQYEEQLRSMVVAENFTEVEREVQGLTQDMRTLNKDMEILRFRENTLETQLKDTPDITRDELLQLFEGLQSIFTENALRHFSEVEEFHGSLTGTRNRRLSSELSSVRTKLRDVELETSKLGSYRDERLRAIEGKSAFDEYRELANEAAKFKQELKSINEFIDVDAKLDLQRRATRDELNQDTLEAESYLEVIPERELNERFIHLTHQLYPNAQSGITLRNNEGENQTRFDLDVHLEAASSDGINDAKIICFDWLIYTHGANHDMQFLWHDNRLFANIDANVRAKWFKFVIDELASMDNQYIVTLNNENYSSMLGRLDEQHQHLLAKATVLELFGDTPENKLLGVQIDLPRV